MSDNNFYIQAIDNKYTLLNRSIGIDIQTQSLSTRTIESSHLVSGNLNNQSLMFSFTVSPTAYIDWNNSVMEIAFKFTNAAGNGIAKNVSIPWNLLLFIFEEIKVQFNGTTVFNKVTGDYLETQTFKLLTEYTNDELNASEIVFAPVGDYNYNVGLVNGYGFTNTDTSSDDPNAKLRFQNWISPMSKSYNRTLYKRPKFRDLFFDMPGFSKNLRNVNINVKIKNSIPLAKITNEGDGIMTITGMKLQLHEYNFSPSSALSTLNNKIQAADEHLSFIDISKQDKTYGPYITVTNQENVQWVAVTQFCHKVSSQVKEKTGAQYQNCGQFLLMNGYGSKDANATVDTLLHRSDLPPTSNVETPVFTEDNACYSPIASIQAQYGSIMYPSNSIDTAVDSNPSLLKTDELYSEYTKSVGFRVPAVPETIFRRTMPFFMVKFTPNIKLIQSGDIMIRMPGFSGADNKASKLLTVIYGQLKSYNIAPSGIVSETIPSYKV